MATTATDRTNVAVNNGKVRMITDYIVRNAVNPGDCDLTFAALVRTHLADSGRSPNTCTDAALLASFKAMLDDLQSA